MILFFCCHCSCCICYIGSLLPVVEIDRGRISAPDFFGSFQTGSAEFDQCEPKILDHFKTDTDFVAKFVIWEAGHLVIASRVGAWLEYLLVKKPLCLRLIKDVHQGKQLLEDAISPLCGSV